MDDTDTRDSSEMETGPDAQTKEHLQEIHTWWEIPAIAHFCSLFKAVFGFCDFDIEDLEEALLTSPALGGSTLVIDIICQLLNGCYARDDIKYYNYDLFLKDIFKQRWQVELGRGNPLSDTTFLELPVRRRVEVLHALCDFRLDADDVAEMLKGLSGDSLRVEPLGMDANGSKYWYFYGTRLYREAPELEEQGDDKRKGKWKKRKQQIEEVKLENEGKEQEEEQEGGEAETVKRNPTLSAKPRRMEKGDEDEEEGADAVMDDLMDNKEADDSIPSEEEQEEEVDDEQKELEEALNESNDEAEEDEDDIDYEEELKKKKGTKGKKRAASKKSAAKQSSEEVVEEAPVQESKFIEEVLKPKRKRTYYKGGRSRSRGKGKGKGARSRSQSANKEVVEEQAEKETVEGTEEAPKKTETTRRKKKAAEAPPPTRRSRRQMAEEDPALDIIFDSSVSKTELKRLAVDGFHNQLSSRRSRNTSRESSVSLDAVKQEIEEPVVESTHSKNIEETVSRLSAGFKKEAVKDATSPLKLGGINESSANSPVQEMKSELSPNAKKGSSRRKSTPQRRPNTIKYEEGDTSSNSQIESTSSAETKTDDVSAQQDDFGAAQVKIEEDVQEVTAEKTDGNTVVEGAEVISDVQENAHASNADTEELVKDSAQDQVDSAKDKSAQDQVDSAKDKATESGDRGESEKEAMTDASREETEKPVESRSEDDEEEEEERIIDLEDVEMTDVGAKQEEVANNVAKVSSDNDMAVNLTEGTWRAPPGLSEALASDVVMAIVSNDQQMIGQSSVNTDQSETKATQGDESTLREGANKAEGNETLKQADDGRTVSAMEVEIIQVAVQEKNTPVSIMETDKSQDSAAAAVSVTVTPSDSGIDLSVGSSSVQNLSVSGVSGSTEDAEVALDLSVSGSSASHTKSLNATSKPLTENQDASLAKVDTPQTIVSSSERDGSADTTDSIKDDGKSDNKSEEAADKPSEEAIREEVKEKHEAPKPIVEGEAGDEVDGVVGNTKEEDSGKKEDTSVVHCMEEKGSSEKAEDKEHQGDASIREGSTDVIHVQTSEERVDVAMEVDMCPASTSQAVDTVSQITVSEPKIAVVGEKPVSQEGTDNALGTEAEKNKGLEEMSQPTSTSSETTATETTPTVTSSDTASQEKTPPEICVTQFPSEPVSAEKPKVSVTEITKVLEHIALDSIAVSQPSISTETTDFEESGVKVHMAIAANTSKISQSLSDADSTKTDISSSVPTFTSPSSPCETVSTTNDQASLSTVCTTVSQAPTGPIMTPSSNLSKPSTTDTPSTTTASSITTETPISVSISEEPTASKATDPVSTFTLTKELATISLTSDHSEMSTTTVTPAQSETTPSLLTTSQAQILATSPIPWEQSETSTQVASKPASFTPLQIPTIIVTSESPEHPAVSPSSDRACTPDLSASNVETPKSPSDQQTTVPATASDNATEPKSASEPAVSTTAEVKKTDQESSLPESTKHSVIPATSDSSQQSTNVDASKQSEQHGVPSIKEQTETLNTSSTSNLSDVSEEVVEEMIEDITEELADTVSIAQRKETDMVVEEENRGKNEKSDSPSVSTVKELHTELQTSAAENLSTEALFESEKEEGVKVDEKVSGPSAEASQSSQEINATDVKAVNVTMENQPPKEDKTSTPSTDTTDKSKEESLASVDKKVNEKDDSNKPTETEIAASTSTPVSQAQSESQTGASHSTDSGDKKPTDSESKIAENNAEVTKKSNDNLTKEDLQTSDESGGKVKSAEPEMQKENPVESSQDSQQKPAGNEQTEKDKSASIEMSSASIVIQVEAKQGNDVGQVNVVEKPKVPTGEEAVAEIPMEVSSAVVSSEQADNNTIEEQIEERIEELEDMHVSEASSLPQTSSVTPAADKGETGHQVSVGLETSTESVSKSESHSSDVAVSKESDPSGDEKVQKDLSMPGKETESGVSANKEETKTTSGAASLSDAANDSIKSSQATTEKTHVSTEGDVAATKHEEVIDASLPSDKDAKIADSGEQETSASVSASSSNKKESSESTSPPAASTDSVSESAPQDASTVNGVSSETEAGSSESESVNVLSGSAEEATAQVEKETSVQKENQETASEVDQEKSCDEGQKSSISETKPRDEVSSQDEHKEDRQNLNGEEHSEKISQASETSASVEVHQQPNEKSDVEMMDVSEHEGKDLAEHNDFIAVGSLSQTTEILTRQDVLLQEHHQGLSTEEGGHIDNSASEVNQLEQAETERTTVSGESERIDSVISQQPDHDTHNAKVNTASADEPTVITDEVSERLTEQTAEAGSEVIDETGAGDISKSVSASQTDVKEESTADVTLGMVVVEEDSSHRPGTAVQTADAATGRDENEEVKEEPKEEVKDETKSDFTWEDEDDLLTRSVEEKKVKEDPALKQVPLYGDSRLFQGSLSRWQLVCDSVDDWETLTSNLKDTRVYKEKMLYRIIKNDFLPEMPAIMAEKERAREKRAREMLPRRSSYRLELKKMEEEEKERLNREAEEEEERQRAIAEEERRQQMKIEEEKRQREEKERAREERANRARLREERARLIAEGKEIPPELMNGLRQDDNEQDDLDAEMQNNLERVLLTIKRNEHSWPFLEAVEEVNTPDFFEVIAEPMDLLQIEKKVNERSYKNKEEFERDMNLVFDNCIEYHGKDSDFGYMAENLKGVFERSMRRTFRVYLEPAPRGGRRREVWGDVDSSYSWEYDFAGSRKGYSDRAARKRTSYKENSDSDSEPEPYASGRIIYPSGRKWGSENEEQSERKKRPREQDADYEKGSDESEDEEETQMTPRATWSYRRELLGHEATDFESYIPKTNKRRKSEIEEVSPKPVQPVDLSKFAGAKFRYALPIREGRRLLPQMIINQYVKKPKPAGAPPKPAEVPTASPTASAAAAATTTTTTASPGTPPAKPPVKVVKISKAEYEKLLADKKITIVNSNSPAGQVIKLQAGLQLKETLSAPKPSLASPSSTASVSPSTAASPVVSASSPQVTATPPAAAESKKDDSIKKSPEVRKSEESPTVKSRGDKDDGKTKVAPVVDIKARLRAINEKMENKLKPSPVVKEETVYKNSKVVGGQVLFNVAPDKMESTSVYGDGFPARKRPHIKPSRYVSPGCYLKSDDLYSEKGHMPSVKRVRFSDEPDVLNRDEDAGDDCTPSGPNSSSRLQESGKNDRLGDDTASVKSSDSAHASTSLSSSNSTSSYSTSQKSSRASVYDKWKRQANKSNTALLTKFSHEEREPWQKRQDISDDVNQPSSSSKSGENLSVYEKLKKRSMKNSLSDQVEPSHKRQRVLEDDSAEEKSSQSVPKHKNSKSDGADSEDLPDISPHETSQCNENSSQDSLHVGEQSHTLATSVAPKENGKCKPEAHPNTDSDSESKSFYRALELQHRDCASPPAPDLTAESPDLESSSHTLSSSSPPQSSSKHSSVSKAQSSTSSSSTSQQLSAAELSPSTSSQSSTTSSKHGFRLPDLTSQLAQAMANKKKMILEEKNTDNDSPRALSPPLLEPIQPMDEGSHSQEEVGAGANDEDEDDDEMPVLVPDHLPPSLVEPGSDNIFQRMMSPEKSKI